MLLISTSWRFHRLLNGFCACQLDRSAAIRVLVFRKLNARTSYCVPFSLRCPRGNQRASPRDRTRCIVRENGSKNDWHSKPCPAPRLSRRTFFPTLPRHAVTCTGIVNITRPFVLITGLINRRVISKSYPDELHIDSCHEKNGSHYTSACYGQRWIEDANAVAVSLIINKGNLNHQLSMQTEHLMSPQLGLSLLDLAAFEVLGIESRGRVSYTFKRHIRNDPDLPCVPSTINFLMNLKSISRQ